ncbi:MAG: LPS assembly lipoprotein LptE [Acetobacteraceae bacterium]
MAPRFWLAAMVSALAGCGFSPVYAPGPGGAPQANLARVFVAVIPNRDGQLLRQALKARLEGSGASAAALYTLAVGYGISSEGIGINPDSSTSFIRFEARANWRLLSAAPGAPPLASGVAVAQDGYSVIVDQYFYSNLSNAAIDRRFADAIANQIVIRLAAYFRNRGKVASR